MNENSCNLFEICATPEAPLCPQQLSAIKHGMWYPDESICRARQFKNCSWIKKQNEIVRLGLTADDGFFTVKMLMDIHVVTKNLKGASPDDPNSELNWLSERIKRRKARFYEKRRRKVAGIKASETLALF